MSIRPWLARLSFALLAVSCVLGLMAALGTRLGVWDYTFGLFQLFPWCLGLAVAAFLVALLWVTWAIAANHGDGGRYGLTALIGSILLLALPLHDISVAERSPAIHDISTDVENPPQFVA